MTTEDSNYEKFIKELIKLTGVSREYAIAAWYALNVYCRSKPVLSADMVAKRYSLT